MTISNPRLCTDQRAVLPCIYPMAHDFHQTLNQRISTTNYSIRRVLRLSDKLVQFEELQTHCTMGQPAGTEPLAYKEFAVLQNTVFKPQKYIYFFCNNENSNCNECVSCTVPEFPSRCREVCILYVLHTNSTKIDETQEQRKCALRSSVKTQRQAGAVSRNTTGMAHIKGVTQIVLVLDMSRCDFSRSLSIFMINLYLCLFLAV